MKRHGAARIALVAAGLILVAAGAASAQSSLGIGSNEVSIEPTGGVFAHFFLWVSEMQRSFYREMTGALKAMRDDGSAAWLLVGLSFAYGIFHAAGPGHGKAVISSYMLANETLLRRGVILSFISAMLQAVSAIVLVSVAFLVLRGTAIKMADATWFMEAASYALIALFGFWLLVTKLRPRRQAASLALELRRNGIGKGDRVAAYLPNIPAAVIGLLASALIPLLWPL